jgi:hypothetical protein
MRTSLYARNSLLTGKLTGIFVESASRAAIWNDNAGAKSRTCGKIPYATEQGIISWEQGNWCTNRNFVSAILESRLSQQISLCEACPPSAAWFDQFSPKEKIRKSGSLRTSRPQNLNELKSLE